jgi:galactokinase
MHFQLYRRAKHVLSEAPHVLRFRGMCLAATSESVSDNVLWELGKHMNGSHTSCALEYDCSCPELNQLTQICREAGAYGSRLTGKYKYLTFITTYESLIKLRCYRCQLGRFTMSLVAEDKVSKFIETLRRSYGPYTKLNDETLAEVVFATKLSSGACGMSLKH